MDIKTHLNPVFTKMVKNYQKTMSIFYPSIGSVGFTERNLSTNFVDAYKSKYENERVFVWYELPILNNNLESYKNRHPETNKYYGHIDAMLVNETRKMIFLIEAKRFVNNKKNDSANHDFDRLNEITNINKYYELDQNQQKMNIFESRFYDFNDKKYDVFNLIIADKWIKKGKKLSEINFYKIINNGMNINFDKGTFNDDYYILYRVEENESFQRKG